jgi:transcriptional regulator
MYDLPYYKEQNEETLKEFIQQYPFAFLTGCDSSNKPVATQVPIFMEERNGVKFLSGHIMRNTDHHKGFVHNENVLAVFTGHHTYVSGTWYSNPHQASTWNYMSVHARGVIRFLEEDALEAILRKTSLHFESNNTQSPTVYDNLPKDYLQKMMKAIVAFEIEVKEMENVFKLSQNRDAQSYDNIQKQLHKQGEDGKVIAGEMKKRTKDVFPEEEK